MQNGKPYRSVVAKILNIEKPPTILDAPSGNGWLKTSLEYKATLDGLDLFESKPDGYRNFNKVDLDFGIPEKLPLYGAIVSCEGIEHIGNPDLFLKTVYKHLSRWRYSYYFNSKYLASISATYRKHP